MKNARMLEDFILLRLVPVMGTNPIEYVNGWDEYLVHELWGIFIHRFPAV